VRAVVISMLVPLASLGAPVPGDEGTPEYRAAAEFVKELGSPRFAAREAAAKKLLDMGAAAIPALIAGARATDEEVRSRSAALLSQAQANEWIRRAEAFARDADGKQKHDLPLLGEWEKTVGKLDAGSRRLFADMVRANGPLLDLATSDRAAAAKELPRSVAELLDPARVKGKQQDASPGSIAAMLFVQTVLKGEKDGAASSDRNQPLYLLANPSVAKALDAKDIGPAYRRLVVRWAESRPDDETMSGLFFALLAHRHPFPEADPHLVQLATSRKNVQVRWVAMEALGRSPVKETNAKLAGLLTDTTTMYDDLGGKDAKHQVRDCALAALIHGRGKKEPDYGLQSYMTANFWVGGEADTISLNLCGFESAADRERGIKKWLAEHAEKK
jgi:hypothetical protein